MQYFKLKNGTQIPKLGFGTWLIKGNQCVDAVRNALEIGYRHIDTAQIYENESQVGHAIADSKVPREEIFLTTKVWKDALHPKAVRESTEESLKKLKTDYVDLLLIHWPNACIPIKETISAMCHLQSEGKVRFLGVSNFPLELLEIAQQLTPQWMVCNQVEYHPYLDQRVLLKAVRKHGMFLTAYSPLARGKVFKDSILQKIAKKYNKTVGQVVLRWLIEQDCVIAIPKANRKSHAQSNFDIFDFQLSETDRLTLSGLRSQNKRLVNPDWALEWD